jgi:hypothetical protein
MAAIDPANHAAHLAILALGCQSSLTHLDPDDVDRRPEQASQAEQLYERARKLGYPTAESPSVPALVTLVALSLYQLASSRFTAAWATFGTCVRQAQAIGCT